MGGNFNQMYKLAAVFIMFTASCLAQSKQNQVQTGTVDAHAANWIPPTATFAAPPAAPPTGAVYVFTDAIATGSCSGGGVAATFALCRWNGSSWDAISGRGPSS